MASQLNTTARPDWQVQMVARSPSTSNAPSSAFGFSPPPNSSMPGGSPNSFPIFRVPTLADVMQRQLMFLQSISNEHAAGQAGFYPTICDDTQRTTTSSLPPLATTLSQLYPGMAGLFVPSIPLVPAPGKLPANIPGNGSIPSIVASGMFSNIKITPPTTSAGTLATKTATTSPAHSPMQITPPSSLSPQPAEHKSADGDIQTSPVTPVTLCPNPALPPSPPSSSASASPNCFPPKRSPAKSITPSASPSNKLKPSNFPAVSVRIGSWEYIAGKDGDVVIKFYYSKKQFVWEVAEIGEQRLKSKIEISFNDILGLQFEAPFRTDSNRAALIIDVVKPPRFFREVNPQPKKTTVWKATTDFTNGQAVHCRRHIIVCDRNILERHMSKLVVSDPRMATWLQKGLAQTDNLEFSREKLGNLRTRMATRHAETTAMAPTKVECGNQPTTLQPIKRHSSSTTLSVSEGEMEDDALMHLEPTTQRGALDMSSPDEVQNVMEALGLMDGFDEDMTGESTLSSSLDQEIADLPRLQHIGEYTSIEHTLPYSREESPVRSIVEDDTAIDSAAAEALVASVLVNDDNDDDIVQFGSCAASAPLAVSDSASHSSSREHADSTEQRAAKRQKIGTDSYLQVYV